MPELIYSWEIVVHRRGGPVVLAKSRAISREVQVSWLAIVPKRTRLVSGYGHG
jgi:hypothetical protein